MIPNAQIDTNPTPNQKSELPRVMLTSVRAAEIYRYLRGWVKKLPEMRFGAKA
jgi:hypothetical protein